jgi:hypothetical protein
MAHGHRLDLVVGDVDHRRAESRLELDDVRSHLDAQLRVEVRQRLVHQEDLRRPHDRPTHGDSLALSAGQRFREALEVFGESQEFGGVLDALLRLALVDLGHLEGESDVLPNGHVGIQGVVLEDHGDVSVARRDVVDDLVADAQLALGDLLEAGEHAQRRRLAAAGRADEDHELTVGDVEIQVVDRFRSVLVPLADTGEADC